MTDFQKKEIQTMLKKHIEQYPSQRKAVDALRNISEATVINIRQGKWDNISDDMWRLLGKQVGYSSRGKWVFVRTSTAKQLQQFFADAAEYSNTFCFTLPAGTGKSYIAKQHAGQHENTFHIECAEYWNKKVFLEKVMQAMSLDSGGYTVAEMMDAIVSASMKMENPVIILDEVDKLPDGVLYFFITFYNMLHQYCGFVLMATDFFAKRINRGVRLNKKGYKEIFSRIGRRFITLPAVTRDEVEEICRQNGCDDAQTIAHIYNECEGDLRRVERGVHKWKQQAKLRKAA